MGLASLDTCGAEWTVGGALWDIAKALVVLCGGLAMFVVAMVVLIVLGRYLFKFADYLMGE